MYACMYVHSFILAMNKFASDNVLVCMIADIATYTQFQTRFNVYTKYDINSLRPFQPMCTPWDYRYSSKN